MRWCDSGLGLDADLDPSKFAFAPSVPTVVSERGLLRGGFLEVFRGRDQVWWPLVALVVRGAPRGWLVFRGFGCGLPQFAIDLRPLGLEVSSGHLGQGLLSLSSLRSSPKPSDLLVSAALGGFRDEQRAVDTSPCRRRVKRT